MVTALRILSINGSKGVRKEAHENHKGIDVAVVAAVVAEEHGKIESMDPPKMIDNQNNLNVILQLPKIRL
jgi:hypothetical protein